MSSDQSIWPKRPVINGVSTTTLTHWDQIHEVVKKILDLPHYVFRGQREASWLLEPSLARVLKGHEDPDEWTLAHLEKFKLASRGRRGPNPPLIASADDWWALGQHHGLATPLLDWTSSPYVALFFALVDEAASDHSVVYALNTRRVDEKVNLTAVFGSEPMTDALTFLRPLSDENSRLVAQAGLFSRSPIDTDIESWVTKHFEGESMRIILLKILIPKSERLECLKALNVMNINHATLFPDLYGAGKHATELLQRALDKDR